MNPRRSRPRGQVIIAVTIALFAMFGILGLVFDLGWSFQLEKEAQAAADSAAMAAALGALDSADPATYAVDCLATEVACATTPIPCAATTLGVVPTNNFEVGCLYALRNGFWPGNSDERQNVTMVGSNIGPAPTAPGVNVYYWVTVRAAQEEPQIFSAILGNSLSLISARATAGIVDSIIPGSLFLLNREEDTLPLRSPGGNPGLNLFLNSNTNCPPGQDCNSDACPPEEPDCNNYSLRTAGRILLSSGANGPSYPQQDFAGEAIGASVVRSPSLAVRNPGGVYEQRPGEQFKTKISQSSNHQIFQDPTRRLGQPNLPNQSMLMRGFVGGDVGVQAPVADPNAPAGTAENPYLLYPGVYYAFRPGNGNNPPVATGEAITLAGNQHYQFVGHGGPGTFGDYVFVGGLEVAGANVRVGPGRYVYAGTLPGNGSNAGYALRVHSGGTFDDGLDPSSAAPNPNGGQIHVLAGPEYTGADGTNITQFITNQASFDPNCGTCGGVQVDNLPNMFGPSGALTYGKSELSLGGSDNSVINLHGLNPETTGNDVPNTVSDDLTPWRKYTIWQDRKNSVYDYPDPSQSGFYGCADLSSNCASPNLKDPNATELNIQASPRTHIHGVVYQPRGSFATMTGGGGYSGPLQIITGGLRVTGNSRINLGLPTDPITQTVVALIE